MTEQIARYGIPPVTPGEHLRAIKREIDGLPGECSLCFRDLLNLKRRIARLCANYEDMTGGSHER